jgi:hypothetical protein
MAVLLLSSTLFLWNPRMPHVSDWRRNPPLFYFDPAGRFTPFDDFDGRRRITVLVVCLDIVTIAIWPLGRRKE